MDDRVVTASPAGEAPQASESACDWEEILEHAVHLLPSQGPIQILAHHNTLHAFEHLPFEEAVEYAAQVYGCQAYLAEDDYREKLASGRFLMEDLSAVLLEELGDEGEKLLGFLGTRHRLRLAMLQYPLRAGPEAELRWLIAEMDALRWFRTEAPYTVRERMIEQTRRWVLRDFRGERPDAHHGREVLQNLRERFGEARIEVWSRKTWG